jgi:hypothetical protein
MFVPGEEMGCGMDTMTRMNNEPLRQPMLRASLLARLGVGFVAMLLATGCTTASPDVSQTSVSRSATVSVPSDGWLLSDYALKHAPYGFSVPAALQPSIKIDQENVVTLGLTPEDGLAVHAYLLEHLEAMGFELDGRSDDSLVFHDAHWEGALTVAAQTAALTLRRVNS